MHVSAQEVESKILSQATLDAAASDFTRNGFVVLESVLPPDRTTRALELCEVTAKRRNKIRCPVPYELLGRWPLKGMVRGDLVRSLLQCLLSDEVSTRDFCWFRISPPGGSSIERVHRDQNCVGEGKGRSPVSISVDVMLTEFTEENGATEIWPGSQLTFETAHDQIQVAAERVLDTPPSQITGPAGSIVLRDQRAWHRGGTNNTQANRCMLSLPGWMVTA